MGILICSVALAAIQIAVRHAILNALPVFVTIRHVAGPANAAGALTDVLIREPRTVTSMLSGFAIMAHGKCRLASGVVLLISVVNLLAIVAMRLSITVKAFVFPRFWRMAKIVLRIRSACRIYVI